MLRRISVAVLIAMAIPVSVLGCNVVGRLSAGELVKEAEAIARVSVLDYARAPSRPDSVEPFGEPGATVRFRVLEVIRGDLPEELVLPGFLLNHDDFNTHRPPYDSVRPNGLAGTCYARGYRPGAEFLLFLKKDSAGRYTTEWAALAPTNEQLHSERDPWLLWVRKQVKKQTS